MKNSMFYQVLENQMRQDLRGELELEIRNQIARDLKMNPQDLAGALDREQARRLEKARAGTSKFDQLGTWLATHLDSSFAGSSQSPRTARQSELGRYRSQQKNPAASGPNPASARSDAPASHAPQTFQARTLEELCAVELLKRQGARLGETFTEAELKAAWRKAAMRTHPDRYAQADAITAARMNALFSEIRRAYEILELVIDHSLAAKTSDTRAAA